MAHRIVQVVLPLAQQLADRHKAWDEQSPYRLSLHTVSKGYDGKMCWVHPRAGAMPTSPPPPLAPDVASPPRANSNTSHPRQRQSPPLPSLVHLLHRLHPHP